MIAPSACKRRQARKKSKRTINFVRNAGTNAGYADFAVFNILDMGMHFVPDMLRHHAQLRSWHARVKSIPEVEAYLARRPACRDVRSWR